MMFYEMNAKVVMLLLTRYHSKETVVLCLIRKSRVGFCVGELKNPRVKSVSIVFLESIKTRNTNKREIEKLN